MGTKLTLTPEAQAKVDAMLEAEYPILAPVLQPRATTGPLGRNAGLPRLVTEADARDNGIVARAEASVARFYTAIELGRAVARRYGLLGAIIKVYYWKVSWHELAYRTVRKYFLDRPVYWEEVS